MASAQTSPTEESRLIQLVRDLDNILPKKNEFSSTEGNASGSEKFQQARRKCNTLIKFHDVPEQGVLKTLKGALMETFVADNSEAVS